MFNLEYFQLTMSLPGDDRIITTGSLYTHGFISGFSIVLDCISLSKNATALTTATLFSSMEGLALKLEVLEALNI